MRTQDDPRVAEIALTVIDLFQGMGLGKTLLARLVTAAMARGVRRFRAFIVPDNAPVIAPLRKYTPSVRFSYDGDMFTADIPLAQVAIALPHAA